MERILMRFSYTHHMPYTDIKKSGQDWPVSNKQFDPQKGSKLFNHYLEDKIAAEDAGFDWIGCNEHHMSPYGLMPNPNLVGAVVANRTKNAGILQSGVIVPLVNPIRLAEEYAMLDVMSNGRLIAGFMRGIPHEYVAYNISPDESYERMEEAIELIKKCWTEPEPFGWEGKFYQYRAVSIWPKPVQKPMPRIVMSASSERSAKIAAKHNAIAGILALTNMENGKEAIKRYKNFANEYGWNPSSLDILVGMPCCIAPTYKEAKEVLQSGQEYFFGVLGGGIRTAQKLVVQKSRYYSSEEEANKLKVKAVNERMGQKGMSFDERVDAGLILCGTPEMVIEQIQKAHKELGHGRMNITLKVGNISDDFVSRSMKYLKEIVFPAVKNLGEELDPAPAQAAE